MSYQVIARKYRPQRFSDVVGQDHVTRTLAHAIEQKRIAHAYIFCGPRGTGKTTIARIFAKCLNATGGPRVDFPDSDPRCQEIAEGRSLDVLEIDAASNRGIDEIRGLRETVKYAPATSKFKIYIIDEVHMLTKEAFNALLKTLEEPPEHVKFMFATTEPEKVLPTILSRCQRFDLRRIPAALIVKHLADIATREKVQIAPAALYAIARGAEGAMRDAESTLDQLISFCGERIEESDVLTMFGLTAHGQLMELSGAVLAGEVESALRHLNELAGHGKDLGRLLADLLNHFRNLLIYQVSKGDPKMLEVTEAEVAALKEQAGLAAPAGLTRILEVLGDAEIRLRDAASKKIMLEVTLLKAIEARDALSIDAVLRQLQGLRGNSASQPTSGLATDTSRATPKARELGGIRADKPPTDALQVAAVETGSAPLEVRLPTPPPQPPPASDAGDLLGLWTSLVDAVGRVSPFTRSYLSEAHPVSFTKNILTIGFDPESEEHIGLVDNARNHALLQTKLQELGHPGAQFKFIKHEATPDQRPAQQAPTAAPASAPAPAPARPAPPSNPPAVPTQSRPTAAQSAPSQKPPSKDAFKDDPLIQKALEIFKGQIVEIRA